jgi:hypothetical protein
MKKKAYPANVRIGLDMQDLYLNPSSVLHCDECHERLGVLHTLRSALFKPQGASYKVTCKHCKHLNIRIKGAYKQQVNTQWEKLEQEMKQKDDAERTRK